jgi:hypothetical protein
LRVPDEEYRGAPSEDPRDSQYWFGAIDARPLALFRIALGLVLLQDLVCQARGLTEFYTDQGIFPRGTTALPWQWSVFALSGSKGGVAVLFALGALATLAFTLGCFTRVATALTFLFFVSLEHRVPEIHNGGDRVAAVLLFFGLFADGSGRYSVDAMRLGARRCVPALPARLMQAVPLLLYLQTAFEKLRDAGAGWFDGSVMEANLRLTGWTRFGAAWLRAHPSLCTLSGAATIALEIFVPLLFYLPLRSSATRLLAVVGYAVLQIGILLTFKVAMFTSVMLAATLLLVLPSWLDRIGGRATASLSSSRERAVGEQGGGNVRVRSVPSTSVGLLVVFAMLAIAPVAPATVGRVLPWAGLDLNIGLFAWAYPSMRWEPSGELEDGRAVDPLPVSADFSDRFSNSLWMQLPYRLRDYEPLARMVCERFVPKDGARLKHWSLTKVVIPPYRVDAPSAPEKRTRVLDADCAHGSGRSEPL